MRGGFPGTPMTAASETWGETVSTNFPSKGWNFWGKLPRGAVSHSGWLCAQRWPSNMTRPSSISKAKSDKSKPLKESTMCAPLYLCPPKLD